ncbi:MAG: hypothetical protein B6U89_04315 [Desulfurococcales archaeon ex4484_58]|nr:MAG: hypothetical protein B6U89_04315 [Desulfurococcales archaeon ex4484_58]
MERLEQIFIAITILLIFGLFMVTGWFPIFYRPGRTVNITPYTTSPQPLTPSNTPAYTRTTSPPTSIGSSTSLNRESPTTSLWSLNISCEVISLENYTPSWLGSDHMPEIFSSNAHYDLWPRIGPYTVNCNDFYSKPYKCLVNIADAIVYGKVEDLLSINCSREQCQLTYLIKIINVFKGNITEEYIEVVVNAWPAREYLDNTSMINDLSMIAVPYPLIDIGFKYILFLKYVDEGKWYLLDDWVWGYYAYLVLDDQVYSLNLLNLSIKLEPEEIFDRENVAWWPKDYETLHETYTQLFTYCGSLEDFKAIINVS